MHTHSDESRSGLALQASWRPWTRLGRFCRNQYAELVAAVLFLTILPLPGRRLLAGSKEESAALIVGSLYYPLVGLLLGAILCLLATLFAPHVPALVLAALLVVAEIMLTGACTSMGSWTVVMVSLGVLGASVVWKSCMIAVLVVLGFWVHLRCYCCVSLF